MARLRRVRSDAPGWTRRRAGKGFTYLDTRGGRISGAEALERIRSLAIPPAWTEVWICPHPLGHLQATGLDEAQRRQYLYHAQWRARRDRLKHDLVLGIARRLPSARRQARRDLASEGMGRDKVLALAFLLLDLAYLRVGGEQYRDRHGSHGLATLLRSHVTLDDDGIRLHFPAKSGQPHDVTIDDDDVAAAVAALVHREDPAGDLLAWENDGTWHDVTSADIAARVRELLGEEATPKFFRTWHATVLAARGLAEAGPPPDPERARRRVIAQVVRDVARELGNTPAVCRASYVDPRVVDLWERGETIPRTRTRATTERAVLTLLG